MNDFRDTATQLEFFDQLFPFHLAFDADLKVSRAGPSLRILCPELSIGDPLEKWFGIRHPRRVSGFDELRDFEGLVIMELLDQDLLLRGEMAPVTPTSIVFAATLWMHDPERLPELGLCLNNFAVHDVQNEMLHYIQSLKRANEEARELSERLELQQSALQSSEKMKSAILDAALDSMVTIDNLGRVIEWNPAAERTFGYTREEALGSAMAAMIIPPEMRDAHHAGLAHYQRTGEGPVLGKRIELTALRKNGESFPIEIAIIPSDTDDGARFTAFIRDITQQKADAQELERSHQLLHAVSEAQTRFISDTISANLFTGLLAKTMEVVPCQWGLIGELLNDKQCMQPVTHAVRISEKSSGEVTVAPGLPAGILEAAVEQLLQATDAGVLVPFDDEQDVIFLSLKRGPKTEVVGFIGFCVIRATLPEDLSSYLEPLLASCAGIIEAYRGEEERRDAEHLLEHEKHQRDAILQGIADGVVVVNEAGRILLANPAAHFLLNLEDKLEPDRSWREAVDALDLDGGCADQILSEDLTRTQVHLNEPVSRVLDVSASTFQDSGAVQGRILVFRDITREREIDRMKSEFVSSVSHELRTPLASIKGFTTTILSDADMPGETRAEFLGIINDESDRLVELIEDLLDLSRIESGVQRLHLKVLALNESLAKVCDLLAPQFAEKDLTFICGPVSDWSIQCDPGHFFRMVQNLLGNACKFTPPGGRVELAVDGSAEAPVLVIRDTGPGIPADDLPHIFKRFYRVKRAGKQPPGTGLGLALVHEIAELHGWRMEIRSIEGTGTEFCMHLYTAENHGESKT